MASFALEVPSNRELTGGDLLAQSLKQLGVEVAFGLHGGHLDAFLMGCESIGIRLVDTRHETVAVQAAEGYCRISTKPGVCFVTANSGYEKLIYSYLGIVFIKKHLAFRTASPVLQQHTEIVVQFFASHRLLPFGTQRITRFKARSIRSLPLDLSLNLPTGLLLLRRYPE